MSQLKYPRLCWGYFFIRELTVGLLIKTSNHGIDELDKNRFLFPKFFMAIEMAGSAIFYLCHLVPVKIQDGGYYGNDISKR